MPKLWVALWILALGACAHAQGEGPALISGPFPALEDTALSPDAEELAALDDVLARAKREEKLALIVLGANWCHDSKAFVKRLADPDVKALLDDHYTVQLVNAGYFEAGYSLVTRFDLPVYTHTPTVLIVDPQTKQLINRDDHFIWRDAYKTDAAQTAAYLAAKAAPGMRAPMTPAGDGAAAGPYMQQIAAFEQAQADRIRQAYTLIGPRLEARTADLDLYWDPVRDLRYRLPDDMVALRQEVRTRLAKGERDFALAFPTYPAFAWEEDDTASGAPGVK